MISEFNGKKERTWWQSENLKEDVYIQVILQQVINLSLCEIRWLCSVKVNFTCKKSLHACKISMQESLSKFKLVVNRVNLFFAYTGAHL